jgi:predicted Zn-dependent peptidase
MTDMVRRPRFDEDSIEPVRDLSLQAIESLKDEPAERASLSLRERHNPPPINRSGMGTPETLAKITRADLLDGWHAQTRPDGAILAVAGEVDSAGGADGIARSFNTLLADWRGGSKEPVLGTAPERGSYHHISDPSAQVHIVLAYEAPREASDDAPCERVLSSVLSGGMSARLFTEVREKRGLCYSVSQSFAAERDWGTCSAYVGTTPERAQESLNVLVAELRKAVGASATITDEEFAVALTGMKSRIIFSGESTSARAHTLASDQHKRGRPRSLDEIAAVYDALTPEKVNAYVKRRAIGPITIVTLGQTPLQPPV